MNKQKTLIRLLIRHASIGLGILVALTGFYFFSEYLREDARKSNIDAESAFNSDQALIANLRTQVEKSGLAEKRFLEIQEGRISTQYDTNTDVLKNWLRDAKASYRFSNTFKLNMTAGKKVENKELVGINYDIVEHPEMRLKLTAMTDVHLFDFIRNLVRKTPGFIRIETLEIKRTGDIDKTALDQFRSGATPYLVEADLGFNWIGIEEKPEKPISPAAEKPEM